MPKLVATVTQGANDAFAQSDIVTGLSNLAKQAWVIDLIQVEFGSLPPAIASSNIEIALTRGSKTAMANVTDRDVLYKQKKLSSVATAVAFQIDDLVLSFAPPTELLIVEDTIYFSIDSALTAAANTCYISIEVHSKTISEQQRLSILASRIGS